MTIHNSLLKDQLEIHLGCKLTQNKNFENINFPARKSVHLFDLYSDASKNYFLKDLFRLREKNVVNIKLRCQSNT